jgi:NAD-dependent dihydropyrimidine dehydrogenase PreA subunit
MKNDQEFDMLIQVNQELCAGCGACADVCPVGAIQLVDHRAQIDEALCTLCEACVDACIDCAIVAIPAPAHNTSIVTQPPAESSMVTAPTQTMLPETAIPSRGLASLAGVAVSYLGREVAPRLADLLIAALERRLTQPATTAPASLSTPSRSFTKKSRGIRRQTRYRGGRKGKW